MTEPAIDILEVINNMDTLLYRIIISIPVNIKIGKDENLENIVELKYYTAISGDRFWMRKDEIELLLPISNKNGEISVQNIYNTIIKEFKQEGNTNDFIFRIDTTTKTNIEKEIQRLSISRDINKTIPRSTRFLIHGSKTAQYHYGYLLDNFSAPFKSNKDQDRFNLNMLFLLFLDKLIEMSVDDTPQSRNCQCKLETITETTLGNFLVKRMIFYKYTLMFYTEMIKVWEQSEQVNMAFQEFYQQLIENKLETHYEPEYIAFKHTYWFDQPENDLVYFLKFVEDSGFKFNK